MSRKDKADKVGKADKPPSGPLGPWRLVLVVFAVATTSGAVLAQSVQTGVGVDLALGRALAVAVVLWILLGSIDRILARASLARHHDERESIIDGDATDTFSGHR
jgi:hypothetical protein